jgi:hypothetical protein
MTYRRQATAQVPSSQGSDLLSSAGTREARLFIRACPCNEKRKRLVYCYFEFSSCCDEHAKRISPISSSCSRESLFISSGRFRSMRPVYQRISIPSWRIWRSKPVAWRSERCVEISWMQIGPVRLDYY